MIKKITLILIMLFTVNSFSQTATVDTQVVTSEKNSPSIVVERGPYLQTGTPTSVIVKWRTDIATESVVNYGRVLGALTKKETNRALTTEHEVALSGLTPNTKYYFNIGNLTEVLSESVSGDMYVITAPNPGTDQFVRAWIIGDPGTANAFQRQVRDAYYNYVDTTATNTGKTDMMLFLGDNAYSTGTDEEYQSAFFDIYDEMFKKSVAWSCLGNHDAYSADSATQSGPYYDIFTFPKEAEAGGTPSGTEAYFSFDYANIHVISLDSHHTSRAIGDPMYNWALSDIQNTKQDWIVVLFHHPAYSKGSHDSDIEDRLIEMRENFMPMLEANGVDLVLNGHSHSYERSYFINGHHGLANTFSLEEITKGGNTVGANGKGDGKEDGDGAYQKADTDPEGAVYITTGSAGHVSGGELNHQAMYISLNKLGSCVMEIEDDGKGGQNMVIKFIRETGEIDDYFTINKTGVTSIANTNEPKSESGKVHYVAGSDLLTITVDRNERLKKVKIYNNIGKLVKKSRKKTINVGKMPKGMYAIEITTKNGTYIESVTIE
ncbi:metallophosphoesterase [Maribacter polysiphoniae]|uniref:Metallophosphoesterase n=1 Tax=Maribacter polysiphoniae TaxID=429344 RepID=A0A316DYZ6_9FLAO|nr:metallophosphoesterase [Maribacter polysiphoniae]MBD1261654.1 metallophosphoesterase [Maribacter polysiphoniae]PWK22542.1 putative secreted protein (Por secretion system target) [Maribacter polysiphoniae]